MIEYALNYPLVMAWLIGSCLCMLFLTVMVSSMWDTYWARKCPRPYQPRELATPDTELLDQAETVAVWTAYYDAYWRSAGFTFLPGERTMCTRSYHQTGPCNGMPRPDCPHPSQQ